MSGSENSGLTAAQVYARNAPFVAPGKHDYNTRLDPEQERQFRAWVAQNRIPFDVNAEQPDYDMRGFWLAKQRGNPVAVGAIDPNDRRMHFPDYWKTPYDATFSRESQWANKATAPVWRQNDLTLPGGTVIFSDKLHKWYPIKGRKK